MSLAATLAFALIALPSQQIPDGVRYRKAPDELNKKAAAIVTKLMKADPMKDDFSGLFSGAVVCGPRLWSALSKGESVFKDPKTAQFHIPTKEGVQQLEGRFFRDPEDQDMFAAMLAAIGRKGKSLTVRKAKPEELSYYWSVISFDIEEPVYVADLGERQILFDFVEEKKALKIFWVDIVGNPSGKKAA